MFTTYGALIGLAIAIFLIIRKATPAYALIFGALAGGLIFAGITDICPMGMLIAKAPWNK